MTVSAGRVCDRGSLARDEALLAALTQRVVCGRQALSCETEDDAEPFAGEPEIPPADEGLWGPGLRG